MHVELLEGNGIAALPRPVEEGSVLVKCANGTMLIADSPAIGERAEEWIEKDTVYVAHYHENRPTRSISEAEEARILLDPDVADAIDAVLPEIEAFERA